MNRIVSTIGALALAACNNSGAGERAVVSKQSTNMAINEVQPPIPPPGTGPDARTPLGETKAPDDANSAGAAVKVVQHYGALIEQRRFPEAERLWEDAGAAADFTADLIQSATVHLQVGKPSQAEGAAGSIYVTEPVTFFSKDKSGSAFQRRADVILRRVNDVPGSTEEQRRWHIARIEWKAAA